MNAGRKRLVLGSRRAVTLVAAVTALVMPSGLLSVPPALADPPNSERPKVADHEKPVPGHDLKVRPRKTDPAQPLPAAKAAWPSPGAAEVDVPSGGKDAGAPAGKLPIKVLAPGKQQLAARATQAVPTADRVRIQVLDRASSQRLGVDGLAFTVARTDASAPGRVKVRLDYSKFAQAFGGAYGARLHLTQLPQCALTTPNNPKCRTGEPVTTDNDAAAKTLTAEVEAAPAATTTSARTAAAGQNATLLVAAAGSDSSQGDYKATSLAASATWKAGGNAGDFTWSYPMRVPPVPSGLTPKVAISYSSGSVDGRTSNTNGQPSWVGEGFDLWPGFIERSYKSCEDDGAPKDQWGNSPGDQCWGYDNATVTWGGKGGELIKASDGTWRTKNDDGTKFEKLTSSSNGNGDNNGEYWRATTTDGTQYYFGLNRLPGWEDGKPETDSTWTSPVFGDDSGEPCHESTFAASWCQQAYRWNLDYVVDPAGNAINYTYGKEINHYGRNIKAEDETPYVRGGYLKTISYGLRADGLFAKPPAQVTFTTSERCIPDANFDCAPSKIGDNPDKWWDVPWDLNCNSGQECKDTHGTLSPTFWSRKRLTKVTTQILKPDGSGYRPVDSWSLDHEWRTADVERDLVLMEISHTGHASTDGSDPVTLPKVTFNPVQLPNRLDKTGDDILGYVRYRLGAIYDESGGQIDISYSEPDCSLSDLPTPETNTTRCMPVIWTPPGREDPITDWFHKYVVTSVIQTDRTGLAPDMATRYEYLGGAAWHFDDDDGLTKEKDKTWSQWRGYGHVRTRTGDYNAPATQTDTYYLRGMDGDRKNKDGGEKSVTVSDGEGGTYTDHESLAGFTLKNVQYNAPGGSVHSKTVNTPWRVQTASRTRSWGTTTANVVRTGTSHTWTAKDGGGWTETKTETDYADSGAGVGRVTSVNDLGDVTTATDDTCTRTTYADNTGKWMATFPSRVEAVSVACTATPDRPAQVVSDMRTYYDNGGFGDAPSMGRATKLEEATGYDGDEPTYVTKSKTTYDSVGRKTRVEDALGQATTTAYTDTRGLTTGTQTTTPPATPGNASTALTTMQVLDPALGLPTRTTDANGLHTDLVYDGLGRLTEVWLPNRSKAAGNQNPNYEFKYHVAEGQITAVTTETLNATGGQRVAKIELLDGWLRPRQIQTPGQDGRLISDTFYDERGQVVKSYAPYSAAGDPETVLFGVGTPGNVETQTWTEYDGLGRKTVEKLMKGNGALHELWRTTYSYGGGDRVSVTPPNGGTPTAEITNALGQVIERRQYKESTPTGDYDATTYTYTPAGKIASVTDPSGNTFTTTYDLRGRKTKTTDPDKGTSTVTYDDLGRPTSTTDARGKKVFVDYDGLGRKTATHEGTADGPLLTSFTYDTAFYGKGKLAKAIRHHGGAQYTNQVLGYDNLGRIEAASVTIPAQQGALAGTYTYTKSYNLDGTVQSEGPPVAGGLPYENVRYSYDTWLRPTRLNSPKGTYVNDVVYSATNKPLILELGDAPKHVWQTFAYESGTQRLESARTSREGFDGVERSAVYHYTDAGTITSITDTSRDGIDNQCFTYDHLQRLTQAWTQGTTDACAAEPTEELIGGPAPYWQSFTYDKAGNRTSETRHGIDGTADTVRTYTYAAPGQGNRLQQISQTGPAGQRTDSYAYDATGNTTAVQTVDGSPSTRTQTFEWNSEGNLAKVTENGSDETYIYDAGGNRLIRKDPAGTTLYLPDGTELRALNGASTATGTRYYSFNGQVVAMRTSGGPLTYLTSDHQGTGQVAVNTATMASTIRRFTPFGSIRGFDDDATWPNGKGFVGGTQDSTGLTHLGAREYDPDTGRFISVDPLMDQADPQQMNGYTYGNNSPVSNSDASGAMFVGAGQGPSEFYWGCHSASPACEGVSHWRGDNTFDKLKYPVTYPDRGELPEKLKRTIYRRLVSAFVQNPPDPREDLTGYAYGLQGKLAYCSDYSNDPLCSSATPGLHTFLDIIGMVPALGDAADIINAIAYAIEGDWKNAGVSGLAILPVIGQAVAGARLARKIPTDIPTGCLSSFVPGTQVLMADGTSKDIEDLRVGDKVLATDPETGQTAAEPVLGTITSKGDKNLVQITVNAEAPALGWMAEEASEPVAAASFVLKKSKSGVLIATDTHPFWVAGDINAWVEAADLKPGMWLRTSAGTYVQVTTAGHKIAHHQRVHNLTVANTHTYYASTGTTPVLVHNCPDLAGDARDFPGLAHTLDEHVNVTREQAIGLAARKGKPNGVFIDEQTAQQVVDYAIAGKSRQISKWLRGSDQKLVIRGTFGVNNPIGWAALPDGSIRSAGNRYTVILQRQRGHRGGYYVFTAYPE